MKTLNRLFLTWICALSASSGVFAGEASVGAKVTFEYHRSAHDDGTFGDLKMGVSRGDLVELAPRSGELRFDDERVAVDLEYLRWIASWTGNMDSGYGIRVILKISDILRLAEISNTKKLRRKEWKNKAAAMIERCRQDRERCLLDGASGSGRPFELTQTVELEFYHRDGLIFSSNKKEDTVSIRDAKTGEGLYLRLKLDEVVIE